MFKIRYVVATGKYLLTSRRCVIPSVTVNCPALKIKVL